MNDLSRLSEAELKETLLLQERLAQLASQDEAQGSFLGLVRQVLSGFIQGEHHIIFARKL